MIDQPVIELLSLLEGDKNIQVVDLNPLGSQLDFRFNTLHKPFDNPKIRQAVFYALNQKDFLVAGYRQPEVLQGVQGAVHLRHAAGHRQGLRGQAHLGLRQVKADPQGGRL